MGRDSKKVQPHTEAKVPITSDFLKDVLSTKLKVNTKIVENRNESK